MISRPPMRGGGIGGSFVSAPPSRGSSVSVSAAGGPGGSMSLPISAAAPMRLTTSASHVAAPPPGGAAGYGSFVAAPLRQVVRAGSPPPQRTPAVASRALPAQAAVAAPAASPLSVGQLVEVLSVSTGTWIKDGKITDKLATGGVRDGVPLPAGSIKVVFHGGVKGKWLSPEQQSPAYIKPRGAAGGADGLSNTTSSVVWSGTAARSPQLSATRSSGQVQALQPVKKPSPMRLTPVLRQHSYPHHASVGTPDSTFRGQAEMWKTWRIDGPESIDGAPDLTLTAEGNETSGVIQLPPTYFPEVAHEPPRQEHRVPVSGQAAVLDRSLQYTRPSQGFHEEVAPVGDEAVSDCWTNVSMRIHRPVEPAGDATTVEQLEHRLLSRSETLPPSGLSSANNMGVTVAGLQGLGDPRQDIEDIRKLQQALSRVEQTLASCTHPAEAPRPPLEGVLTARTSERLMEAVDSARNVVEEWHPSDPYYASCSPQIGLLERMLDPRSVANFHRWTNGATEAAALPTTAVDDGSIAAESLDTTTRIPPFPVDLAEKLLDTRASAEPGLVEVVSSPRVQEPFQETREPAAGSRPAELLDSPVKHEGVNLELLADLAKQSSVKLGKEDENVVPALPAHLQIGEIVEARHRLPGGTLTSDWYPAQLISINDDGTYQIDYDDGYTWRCAAPECVRRPQRRLAEPDSWLRNRPAA
eukprot:TRINITY_DN15739_c0_g1_i1.p1 TRINITY_DN15739_c0_g1~~TRINITY_DN15739_c0_g1_i1.p1  ORF type:complete len:697 (+),score=94.95 TRINITY_DN15739_c0_g1_i1:87-2177(+)